MRNCTSLLLLLLFVGAVVLTTGCPGLVPGSRVYQPLPRWEAKFFAKARRDVFPNDVRRHPNAYTNVLVAWTGVITDIECFTNGSSRVVRFTAEHHYFDWIEDFGIQPQRFFLSPRGEGLFAAAWRDDSPEDQRFVRQFSVGDMLVAYGYPSILHGDVVGLYPTENLRAFGPRWFRMDVFDYGRPGEPVKVLNLPH